MKETQRLGLSLPGVLLSQTMVLMKQQICHERQEIGKRTGSIFLPQAGGQLYPPFSGAWWPYWRLSHQGFVLQYGLFDCLRNYGPDCDTVAPRRLRNCFSTGHNLAFIPRDILRQRLNVIPQDPYWISTKSVRFNMDPWSDLTSLHDDTRFIEALMKCQVWHIIEVKGGLDATMDQEFLSHGQRQLFYLARAILRKSKVVVPEEVSARYAKSLDPSVHPRSRSRSFPHSSPPRPKLISCRFFSSVPSANPFYAYLAQKPPYSCSPYFYRSRHHVNLLSTTVSTYTPTP